MNEDNQKTKPRCAPGCLFGGVMAIVGVSMLIYQFWGLGMPALYESHRAPGKPTVEIRWTYGGFLGGGAAFDAYLVQGWRRQKILTMLDNIDSHFGGTTNAVARTYAAWESTGRLQIYQVAWSADSQRVAIAFHGYFVAAYDRVTGKTIELKDYGHDYRRCDSEIERFLRQR